MTHKDKRYLQDKLCHERDKELLLKDLCGRVPYGVKCKYNDGVIVNTLSVNFFYEQIEGWERYVNHTLKYNVEDIKPYLFPLSSMTEEQKYEYDELIHSNNIKAIEGVITSTDCSTAEINWLYKNHIDIYGLIPKGLAIDATGLNIY